MANGAMRGSRRGHRPNRQAVDAAGFRTSEAYRHYVVWLLFVVYVFNFVDRQILGSSTSRSSTSSACRLAARPLGGSRSRVFYSIWAFPSRGSPIIATASTSSPGHRGLERVHGAVTGFARNFWQLGYSRASASASAKRAAVRPLTRSSATTSSRRSAPPRSRSIRWASMAAVRAGLFIGGISSPSIRLAHAFFLVGSPGSCSLCSSGSHCASRRAATRIRCRSALHEPPPFWDVLRDLWRKHRSATCIRSGPACVRQLRREQRSIAVLHRAVTA